MPTSALARHGDDQLMQAQRLEATIHGHVQGVGFRWFVRRRAERLGLVGWVANEPGGAVRVVVEGSPAAVQELVNDLRVGPPGAVVDRVESSFPLATSEFSTFEIRAREHRGD